MQLNSLIAILEEKAAILALILRSVNLFIMSAIRTTVLCAADPKQAGPQAKGGTGHTGKSHIYNAIHSGVVTNW